ncbi:MAG: hypothetical protein IH599_04515, partial [Bacteroidales bacterium]|nr:hypothetical protein [Bacteroidales bacterium]
YSVIARAKGDSSVWCSGTVTLTAIFGGTPPVALVAEDAVICPDAPVPVHLGAAPVANWRYHWSPTEGLNANNISNPLALPDSTKVYTLVVTDPATGCSDVGLVEVIVRSPVADAGPDGFFCGVGTFLLGSPSEYGIAYHWEPSNAVSDSAIAQPTVTMYSGDISFVLSIIDTLTGCTDQDTVILSESASFFADAGPDTLICEVDNPVRLGSSDSSAWGYLYAWIPSEGLDDPTSARPFALPVNTTTYTLIVSRPNSQGCDKLDEVTISVDPAGVLPLDAGPDMVYCQGQGPVIIGPVPLPGLVYQWSPDTGLSDPTIAQPLASPDSSIRYVLTVRDTINCLIGIDSLLVHSQPLPIDPAGMNVSICLGDSVDLGILEISGADYEWSPTLNMDDPLSANPTVAPSASTWYTLTITLNSCVMTDMVYVTVNPLPVANAGPDLVLCNNASVQIG